MGIETIVMILVLIVRIPSAILTAIELWKRLRLEKRNGPDEK